MSSRATSSPASRERLGLLLGFIGMVIFGGTLPATRIDPVKLAGLLAPVRRGALAVAPACLHSRRRP